MATTIRAAGMSRKGPASGGGDEDYVGAKDRAKASQWTQVENLVRGRSHPAPTLTGAASGAGPVINRSGWGTRPGRRALTWACVHLIWQAALRALIAANETTQRAGLEERKRIADERYPACLKEVTAAVGGVVQWDGKSGYTVEDSCRLRQGVGGVLQRAQERVLRECKNKIAPVCHKVIGLAPPGLPSGKQSIRDMRPVLWDALWKDDVARKEAKKRKEEAKKKGSATTKRKSSNNSQGADDDDDDDDEEEEEGEEEGEGEQAWMHEAGAGGASGGAAPAAAAVTKKMPDNWTGGPYYLTWEVLGPWGPLPFGRASCLALVTSSHAEGAEGLSRAKMRRAAAKDLLGGASSGADSSSDSPGMSTSNHPGKGGALAVVVVVLARGTMVRVLAVADQGSSMRLSWNWRTSGSKNKARWRTSHSQDSRRTTLTILSRTV